MFWFGNLRSGTFFHAIEKKSSTIRSHEFDFHCKYQRWSFFLMHHSFARPWRGLTACRHRGRWRNLGHRSEHWNHGICCKISSGFQSKLCRQYMYTHTHIYIYMFIYIPYTYICRYIYIYICRSMYIYVYICSTQGCFPTTRCCFFCVPYKTGDLRRSNDSLVKIWWLTSSGSSSTDEPICWYIYIYIWVDFWAKLKLSGSAIWLVPEYHPKKGKTNNHPANPIATRWIKGTR